MTLLQPANTINILLVDDTPDNLRLLVQILESQGYLVRKALNGRMALQGAHRQPPNLILLDITMPEMDGYEVCQQLKASEVTANIPIIFISVLDRIDNKVRAFEMGGQDYITKPFQEWEVLMRVKNQLLIQQQQQLKIARRTQSPCYLLFADLDGLKQVNDTLGHERGDGVIADAAQILKQTFRDADIVARLGGDEFAILIPACSDYTNDFHIRLQTSIDRFNQESDRPYQLSMSVGVQFCAFTDDTSLGQLLAQADKLMYEHKRMKGG